MSLVLDSSATLAWIYSDEMAPRRARGWSVIRDASPTFLSGPIEVLPFETTDADEAGDIRAALERAGTPIGPYDVLVAAQARRRDALLVTANEREFARVPRLKFEDWAMRE